MGRLLSSVLRKFSCTSAEPCSSSGGDSPLVWNSCRTGSSPSSGCSNLGSSPRSPREVCAPANQSCSLCASSASCSEETFICEEQDVEAVLQALLKREALAAAAADPHWLAAQLSGRLAAARSRLLSWLRMAALYHSYSVITAEHAANFLDRYLACTASASGRVREMELAAVAAFSLACKMEEVYVPDLKDELQMVAPWPRFLPEIIERMELTMLKVLGWRLACITPSDLLQPILEATPAWQRHFAEAIENMPSGALGACRQRKEELMLLVLRKALAVLTAALTEPELTHFRASEVAAASLVVSVQGVCPDSLADSLQPALLERFPKAAACLPALLHHCAGPAHGAGRHDAADSEPDSPSPSSAVAPSPRDTPAAKRCCRAPSPTSVLDL